MPNGKIPSIVVTGAGPKDERELSMISLDRENARRRAGCSLPAQGTARLGAGEDRDGPPGRVAEATSRGPVSQSTLPPGVPIGRRLPNCEVAR
jgi:hypothetical protein